MKLKSKYVKLNKLFFLLIGLFILFSFSAESGCEEDVDFASSDGSNDDDSDDTADDDDDSDDTADDDDDLVGDDSADDDDDDTNTDSNTASDLDDDDNDGIANSVEQSINVGTNSALADSDGDGISDGLEFAISSGDPLNFDVLPVIINSSFELDDIDVMANEQDRDQDGLGRTFEEENDLDDDDADIDNDGFNDGLELVAGSDPFSSLDTPTRVAPPLGVESIIGGPSTDTDGDGLADFIDASEDGDPAVFDTDSDGFSDGIEFIMGSGLRDAQSVPNFTVPARPDVIN